MLPLIQIIDVYCTPQIFWEALQQTIFFILKIDLKNDNKINLIIFLTDLGHLRTDFSIIQQVAQRFKSISISYFEENWWWAPTPNNTNLTLNLAHIRLNVVLCITLWSWFYGNKQLSFTRLSVPPLI